MNTFASMLPILGVGMLIVMAGIVIFKSAKQSIESALMESLVWGPCFFMAFSLECLVLENI